MNLGPLTVTLGVVVVTAVGVLVAGGVAVAQPSREIALRAAAEARGLQGRGHLVGCGRGHVVGRRRGRVDGGRRSHIRGGRLGGCGRGRVNGGRRSHAPNTQNSQDTCCRSMVSSSCEMYLRRFSVYKTFSFTRCIEYAVQCTLYSVQCTL